MKPNSPDQKTEHLQLRPPPSDYLHTEIEGVRAQLRRGTVWRQTHPYIPIDPPADEPQGGR